MDRNREARRAPMAAAPNALSRRRHRSCSLRDSPEEEGQMELHEPGRLRDRGVKNRDREWERDRERDRISRSKRRRESRMIHGGSNREDGGGDSSEESVNDEEEDDEDDGSGIVGVRMLPPPATPAPALAQAMSNHHPHNHHRKSLPVSGTKVFRTAAPAPAWKVADEMIGVSVPRKARSASTKRSHDWISGSSGMGSGTEQIQRQSSTSPVRLASAASPAAAPVSPSSSNASVRKKMKPNGVMKPRPPKSSSKSSSSNPEELEIEIAEVLYDLMTQSQAPSKKEMVSNDSAKLDSNKSSSDAKSRVSSPISTSTPSTALPLNSSNSAVLSAIAPKRKKPRQVPETAGNFSLQTSQVLSVKSEIDNKSSKTEVSSHNLESHRGYAADNGGVPCGFTSDENPLPCSDPLLLTEARSVTEERRDKVFSKEEASSPRKESRVDDSKLDVVKMTAMSTSTKLNTVNLMVEGQREEKFQIDLMAPPSQLRSSPEIECDVNIVNNPVEMGQMSKDKADDKFAKVGKEEAVNLSVDEETKQKTTVEEVEESKKRPIMNKERNIDLHLDLEKPERECLSLASSNGNRPQQPVLNPRQQTAKAGREETNAEKTAKPGSLPLQMSIANWPGGLPPIGYVTPLQGVVSMDGNTVPSTSMQPIFTQPRPKRCATHCYIARNIHYLQQLVKMNPFWPAAAGSGPIFGAKPCSLSVLPSPELNVNGRSLNTAQEKGQGLSISPAGKEKSSQSSTVQDPAQRKQQRQQQQQQILLQQALPPAAPNNILHGPAFIFPFNQQQAAVAAASVRPGPTKSTTTAAANLPASSLANSASSCASVTTAAAMSFNYPNIPANETQYLAFLQNNAYPFPIPAAVGAPPNYRATPHVQPLPLFNGSFYSSQMIHPSQVPQQQQQQQQPPPPPASQHHSHQNPSSISSSSQKHLQIHQQRQPPAVVASGSGNPVQHSYPASKNRVSQHSQHLGPPQSRHLESEVGGTGGDDSPSTSDSRVSRVANMGGVYGQNFPMPINGFALMTPAAAAAAAALAGPSGNGNDKKQQQQQTTPQQSLKGAGIESLPPQAFAVSFTGPINGSAPNSTHDISSIAQNHAILQSLPESTRQNYQQIMAAAAVAHQAQHKKNYRISDETKTGGAADSSAADEDRKVGGGLNGKAGGAQSITFSRPDLMESSLTSSIPSTSTVIDSSGRNMNLASTTRTTRTAMLNSMPTTASHNLQAQLQQQVIQLQKQQQQQQQQQHQQNQQFPSSIAVRSKNAPLSNGSVYPDHFIPSAPPTKFPNSITTFPQSLVQTTNSSSSSPTQSPQWKNSTRTHPSQVPSLSSSPSPPLKNIATQQQMTRTHQQSHTQISFGVNPQKPSSSLQGQQQQANNNSTSNQSPSPPMVVGSPTSSLSKGAGGGTNGSPRTNPSSTSTSNKTGQACSLSSSQKVAKNSPAISSQRSSPSILGSPHITSYSQSQTLKMTKEKLQQAQLFFPNSFRQSPTQSQVQAQSQAHSSNSTSSLGGVYYLPRSQLAGSSLAASSSGALSLTLPSTTTSDPAKAIAAATASSMKGGGLTSQGIIHAAQFAASSQPSASAAGFSYTVPAAVQVKPAEQKQSAA